MKEIKHRSDCPVSYTLDFLGDKWTLLILRDMILDDKSTYGEFLGSYEKIATNILADRLNTLETHGFVTKQTATDKKSKLIYRITEKGITLVPMIMEMIIWGSQFHPYSPYEALLQALQTDKQGVINKYQEKLRAAVAKG
ncbi:transcriptional regulator, HxlR family [Chitinophaga sp. YR627]|uniref:winged helix-turn-helix transcriptional regulator n=1 Tax=Chitinophaga sp. YR627 TaxID=1881041 RepID=UPI0008DEB596|nr:helix-turn-helix domain-containing protein [Chitinophaga sp. YR627]SFO29224.1 transcriptional regulator, HxlR family [Chitinophaga sp. YR627]